MLPYVRCYLDYEMTNNTPIHVGVTEAHREGDEGNGAGSSHAWR